VHDAAALEHEGTPGQGQRQACMLLHDDHRHALVLHQGAGDRHHLLLAARQLVPEVAAPFAQPREGAIDRP
jgi:hypothetical protein